jgi:arginase
MKTIRKIGVVLKEGCDIEGGQFAIDALQKHITMDDVVRLDERLIKDQDPLYLDAVVDLNEHLKASVKEAYDQGEFPLVFGGDHALAIGSITGVAQAEHSVLWIDAHGDCNTEESSDSKRIHGMPLAVVQGHGHPSLTDLVDHPIEARNILLVGIRSLDDVEEELMKQWGVCWLSMEEIRRQGLEWMHHEVMLFAKQAKHLHVSFDCDSMDPMHFPGVNTPVRGGFVSDEILPLLENVLSLDTISSMDIVEYNPTRDPNFDTLNLIQAITKLLETQLRRN